MFNQIVSTVAKHGYYRATQQCCAWIKAVKRKYKEIADRLRKSVKDRELEEDDIPAHFSFFVSIDAVVKNISLSSAFARFRIQRYPARA